LFDDRATASLQRCRPWGEVLAELRAKAGLEPGLQALRKHVGRLDERAEAYLGKHPASSRTWLFPGGLDEVETSKGHDLAILLKFVATLRGAVFLGTRPYGLDDHYQTLREAWLGLKPHEPLPDQVKAYRLAPFTVGRQGQVEQFLGTRRRDTATGRRGCGRGHRAGRGPAPPHPRPAGRPGQT